MDEFLFEKYSLPFRCILIFGPPGSGKGTLGKALAQISRHVHLSSGDIFRSLAPESPAGKLFYTYANRGHLVPDNLTVDIWRHYLDGLIAINGYRPERQLLLLDGIPRTLKQAHMLESYVAVQRIVVLRVDEIEILLQRIQKRARLERRCDDVDGQVLRTRIEVYQKEIDDLLRYYPAELICSFNALQRPVEVVRDVLNALAPHL
jgi:adenylate kinase